MEQQPEKSLDDIVQGISDPCQRQEAIEWIKGIVIKSDQWSTVKKGGDIDQELLKEVISVEFHSIPMFSCLTGTNINQVAAYNQARELAESKGEPEMMDSYVTLILANEVSSRLKDGRLVISGMSEETGPVLVSVEPKE